MVLSRATGGALGSWASKAAISSCVLGDSGILGRGFRGCKAHSELVEVGDSCSSTLFRKLLLSILAVAEFSGLRGMLKDDIPDPLLEWIVIA